MRISLTTDLFCEQDLYELVEQKPVDKIEPKFHEGDWVVCEVTGSVYQIKNCNEILSNHKYWYELTNSGYGGYISSGEVNHYHLWTIQDAKDGDVLYDGNNPCLFRKKMEDDDAIWVDTYCGINVSGTFNVNDEDECWCLACDCVPVTKEQRDLLFSKIKEAGYEWDAEKKELKKIIDEKQIKKNLQDNSFRRMFEQKSAWNEEDETALGDALWCCKQAASIAKDENDMGNIWYAENWLKSLKDRYTWKPNEEQIKAFEFLVRSWGESGTLSPYGNTMAYIMSLLNDLKQLKAL